MSNTTTSEAMVLNPKLETRKEKRNFLRSLSKEIQQLAQITEDSVTVNDELIERYREQEGEEAEFNNLWQWNKKGYKVKKGESSFLVWGKPRDLKKGEEAEADEEEAKSKKFWPLCYLFSSNQVERKEAKNVK